MGYIAAQEIENIWKFAQKVKIQTILHLFFIVAREEYPHFFSLYTDYALVNTIISQGSFWKINHTQLVTNTFHSGQ